MYILKNKKLVLSLISTFIWGIIAHAYMFLSSNFSHDSLNALYFSDAEIKWKIAIGRFLVIPIRTMFGSVCVPWVYGLVSLIFIGLAVYLIVSIFEIENELFIILSAGILSINVTVTAMTATYLYELPFDMLAMLLAVAAVYYNIVGKNIIQKYIAPVIFLFLSMGLYQSYVCVAVMLYVLFAIYNLYKSEGNNFSEIKSNILFLLKAAATVVVGVIVYFIINKVVCLLANVTQRGNFDFVYEIKNNLSKNLVHSYLKVVRRIILPFDSIPKVFLGICCVGLILICAILIIKRMVEAKCGIIKILFVIVMCALLPIFMNLFGLVNYYSHDLMLYSIFVIYPFIFKVIEDNSSKIKRLIPRIASIFMVIIIWNNILVANSCYLRKEIENKAILSVMTRVLADLEKRNDYEIGETPLVFCGFGPFKWEMQGFDNVSEITGMYFRSPTVPGIDWYFDVYKAYFDYVLKYPMVTVDKDTYDDCEEIVEDRWIPPFPYDGYIYNNNGILIINLGMQ